MTKKQIWIVIGAVLLMDAIMIPAVLYFTLAKNQNTGEAGFSAMQPTGLPVLYPVPDFTFTAQNGQPFGKAQVAGKVWVADVFFTSCAGPCPVLSANIAGLAKDYASDPRLQFVSFTVDPERDTPEVLMAYGNRYGADFSRWTFLTGAADKLQDLAKNGLKLGAVDDALIHSEYFVLVDAKGNVRGYATGTDPEEVKKLKAAIDAVLKEAA